MEIKCAFCSGTGKESVNPLFELATCQVCGGRGKVEVMEPAIPCAFCKTTGIYPRTGIACTVCLGMGMVTIAGSTEKCRKCKGTGIETESGLPCLKCRGKGVLAIKSKEDVKG
jgi:DnaJ-class molecular chaperone